MAEAERDGVPVFVGEHDIIEQLTGFHLHRGALASMQRPELPSVESLVARARGGRVAIFEDIVDHTNLGAGFRAAAALGVDAVLITPRCADPLYRRSIRVSMGTVFQVPWTRLDRWPADLRLLRDGGYRTAALALSDDSITLDELAGHNHQRLALILGTEGHGLHPATLARGRRRGPDPDGWQRRLPQRGRGRGGGVLCHETPGLVAPAQAASPARRRARSWS